ncbi:helix-turn-helix domain-containing protein [Flagellimonas myxillae]|uniref:helix-turn-helix domain-containing protein n=1 Tax=Flagellimonas myxillae TaxID=2942214 RepID=UPI00201F69D2|nr:helix-turn-helix domain-containing protein [Muricauda myxillae]MCL6267678.1 helix-turn-helix domain-containing protein [Muricauda myxillae]
MGYLLVLGIAQAIFFVLVLIFGKRSSLPSRILISWMLIIAANLFGVLLAVNGFFRSNPNLFGYDTTLVFLHGPMLYLYVVTSIASNPKLKWEHLIHFIPYVFFTCYLIYFLKIENRDAGYQEIRQLLYDPNTTLLILEVCIHALFIIYIIASNVALKIFQKKLPASYSFTEGIDFKWLQKVMYALLSISAIILVSMLLSDVLGVFSLEFKGLIFYGSMALLPFYLFFHAINRKMVYPSEHQVVTQKYKNSTLTQTDVVKIQDRLETIMTMEKPFLDGQLSISKLASMLNIHQKELSQVINERYQTNFFHFVNGYRVAEVEKKIANPAYQNFSLLGIAFDSGFNTKSAFSKAFKRVNGITPSEFKKRNQ